MNSKTRKGEVYPFKSKPVRRRVIGILFITICVLGVLRFIYMRQQDLKAWPTALNDVSFSSYNTVFEEMSLASPQSVSNFMANLTSPSKELMNEYHQFQTFGLGDEKEYPLIDEKLGEGSENLLSAYEFWSEYDAFDMRENPLHYADFIGFSSEFAVLGCYQMSAGGSNEFIQAGQAGRIELLEKHVKMTSGGGLLARAAALNNIMLIVREIIMNPEEVQGGEVECSRQIESIRALEGRVGNLGDALRSDYNSIKDAVSAIYKQLAGKRDSEKTDSRRLAGMSSVMVALLGGNEADTQANMAALFSHLIRNSESDTYTEDGLTAGLPAWLGHKKKRSPWTRDPVGAAIATSYMQNAKYAHAVMPSILLELRAARIIVALNFYKQAKGDFPENFGELIQAELLETGDLYDPFSTVAGAEMIYSRENGGWRFYSVGLNQIDDGGVYDSYRVKNVREQKQSDFIFISREREYRTTLFEGN
jgi:hypothetical protein